MRLSLRAPFLLGLCAALTGMLAAATAQTGIPTDGALGLQPAATRIMERLHFFHNFLLAIITLITLFVLGLLLFVMIRYRRSSNPEPRRFSHNTTVEIVWTVVPVFILVAIAIPSFPNLYYKDVLPDLERIAQGPAGNDPNVFPEAAAEGWITVKAQGNQWNWTYQYPDLLDDAGFPVEFVSNPVHVGLSTDGAVSADSPRLLATDYPMVIPAMRYIRYQTTASDVIHSWTVPAFGIKTDAIPGKLNEGWFLVEEPGVYYGQCSEMCGINHAFMPIEVRVVPQAQYDRWAELILAGEFDAAFEAVREISIAGAETRYAARD